MTSTLLKLNKVFKTQTFNFIKSSTLNVLLRGCSTKSELDIRNSLTPPVIYNFQDHSTSNLDQSLKLKIPLSNYNSALDFITIASKNSTKSISTSCFDEQITKAFDIIYPNVTKLNNYELVNLLRSIINLQIPFESPIFKNVETEIIWRLKKMNLKNLVLCLYSYHNSNLFNSKKDIVKQITIIIEQRIFEVQMPADVIQLLSRCHLFDRTFIGKIEEKSLEILPKMNQAELLQVLFHLCASKNRCLPLLRGLCYYINRDPNTFSINQCIDLLYSLQNSHIIDLPLLNRVSEDLIGNMKDINSNKLISALLLTGQLKWRHNDLMQGLTERFEEKFDELQFSDLCCFIATMASVDYMPAKGPELFEKIEKIAMKQTNKNNHQWLNLVWNLAILGQYNLLSTVLIPQFYQPLIAKDNQNFHDLMNKLKLMNIDAVSQLKFSHSPAIEASSIKYTIPETTLEKTLNTLVLNSLKGLIPDNTKLATNLNTSMGFNIVAEFITDTDGQIQSLKKYGIKAGLGTKDLISLPDQFHRIALITANYKDYTHFSESVVGIIRMKKDLLTKAGYKVILVSYKELSEKKTLESRIKYLKSKLKEIIKSK